MLALIKPCPLCGMNGSPLFPGSELVLCLTATCPMPAAKQDTWDRLSDHGELARHVHTVSQMTGPVTIDELPDVGSVSVIEAISILAKRWNEANHGNS